MGHIDHTDAETQNLETRKGERWADRMYELIGIYISNAHLASMTGEAGIYPLTAMINHSCDPNCAFTSDDEGVLYVVATQAIEVGEEVALSYVEAIGKQSLGKRRSELQQSFAFCCECSRCVAEAASGNSSDGTGGGSGSTEQSEQQQQRKRKR
jgi:hypothetical protein